VYEGIFNEKKKTKKITLKYLIFSFCVFRCQTDDTFSFFGRWKSGEQMLKFLKLSEKHTAEMIYQRNSFVYWNLGVPCFVIFK
jgi:hypothetical protein